MSRTGQVVWCGVWIRSFLKLSIVCVHRWEICLSHRISGWWNLLRVIKIVGMIHETIMIRLRHDDKQGNNNYLLRKLAFKVFFANWGRVIILSFETNIKFEVMKDTAYTAYTVCRMCGWIPHLLYLPSEFRSSRISAWWSSSRLSIDLGWSLCDIPSARPMSWNWNMTWLSPSLCNYNHRQVGGRWQGTVLTMAWVWAHVGPMPMSPPGSRGECGL